MEDIKNNEDIQTNTSDSNASQNKINSSDSSQKNAKYVFKIVFHEIRGEFDGGMIIIGDTAESKFSSVDIVMDKNFGLDISSEWSAILDKIKNKRQEVEDGASNFLIFIRKIESYFNKSISNAKIDKINKIIVTTEDEMLRNVLIKNILEGELKSLIAHGFEIEMQLKDDINYYSESQDENKTEFSNIGNSDNIVNRDEIELDVIPMIDPGEGIKASEIKEGERIFVRITDDSVIGKHIARSITKNESPEETPVRAPVILAKKNVISKFRASSEVMEIKVRLDEGVFGKLVVQTEVKLRVKLDEEKENETPENNKESVAEEEVSFIPYIIFFIFIVIFLIGIIKFLGN